MKRAVSLLCVIITISLIFCSCNSKNNNNYTSTNTEISYTFVDYSMFSKYWSNGVYKCGADFPEGDYYIMSVFGAEAYYDVADSPNNFTWTDYRMFRKITAKQGQYISLSEGALMVSADEVDTDNLSQYGVFLVGKDIKAGDYLITTLTDEYHTNFGWAQNISGAYQISNESPENKPEYCTPLFDEQTYISVTNGQYIIINNAKMTISE